jgi:hypothetical protein
MRKVGLYGERDVYEYMRSRYFFSFEHQVLLDVPVSTFNIGSLSPPTKVTCLIPLNLFDISR